jgi:hypothetical protein
LPVVVKCEKIDSVLFFDTAGEKKSTIICKQMKHRVCFAPAGATWGAAPRPRRLVKKAVKTFMSEGARVVVDVLLLFCKSS